MRLSILCLAALLALPASAQAATVGREGTELVYRSAPGELDDLTIEPRDGHLLVYERYKPITPGPGCGRYAKEHLDCALDGLTAIRVITGDGTDWVTVTAEVPVSVDLGPGDDYFAGRGSTLTVSGGEGRDVANASLGDVDLGPGDDAANVGVGGTSPLRLQGGDGNDDFHVIGETPNDVTIDGGAGDDTFTSATYGDGVTFVCGPGNDRLRYLTADDRLGDGCPAAMTDVHAARTLTGTLSAPARVEVVYRRAGRVVARGAATRPAGPLRLRLARASRLRGGHQISVTIVLRTRGERAHLFFYEWFRRGGSNRASSRG